MTESEQPFIGPLTQEQARRERRRQDIRDLRASVAIAEQLKGSVPEKCKDCFPNLFMRRGEIALRVVKGEIDELQAHREVIAYTANCTGAEAHPYAADADLICPRKRADDAARYVR